MHSQINEVCFVLFQKAIWFLCPIQLTLKMKVKKKKTVCMTKLKGQPTIVHAEDPYYLNLVPTKEPHILAKSPYSFIHAGLEVSTL